MGANNSTPEHQSTNNKQRVYCSNTRSQNRSIYPIQPLSSVHPVNNLQQGSNESQSYGTRRTHGESSQNTAKATSNIYPNLRTTQTTETQKNADNFVFVNQQNKFNPTAASAPPVPSTSASWRSQPKTHRAVSRTPFGLDLTCSTCKNDYTDKIYQCQQGHSSCGGCKITGRNCGKCGHQLTHVRNIDVEQYLDELEKKCPNAMDGCRLSFTKVLMEKHLKECPFNELRCPIMEGNCKWRGKLPQIKSHFEADHPDNNFRVNTEMCLQNIYVDCFITKLITFGIFHFLFHCKVSQINSKIYMTVQMIGSEMSANKWSYEIQVFNKAEPRRKYHYVDKCWPHKERLCDVFEGQCATLPLQYATTFVNRGDLVYKVYVKKVLTKETRVKS